MAPNDATPVIGAVDVVVRMASDARLAAPAGAGQHWTGPAPHMRMPAIAEATEGVGALLGGSGRQPTRLAGGPGGAAAGCVGRVATPPACTTRCCRYALDVNISSLDVLSHKRLLDEARSDPTTVSFAVRPVEVLHRLSRDADDGLPSPAFAEVCAPEAHALLPRLASAGQQGCIGGLG